MSNVNLNPIVFQSSIRSKPLRNNFQNIQNAVNDNNSRIMSLESVASGGSSPAEVVSSRGTFSTLNGMINATYKAFGSGVLSYYRELFSTDTINDITASGVAITETVNTTTYIDGTGSLNLGASGAGTAEYEFDAGSMSYKNKFIRFSIYMTSGASTISALKFRLYGNVGKTEYMEYDLSLPSEGGWTEYIVNVNNYDTNVITVDTDTIEIGSLRFTAAGAVTSGNYLIDKAQYYGNECKAVPGASYPDVAILEGNAIVEGNPVYRSEVNATLATKPTTNPRYDLITIDGQGVVRSYQGVESAIPSPLSVPSGHITLAHVLRRTTEDGTTPILYPADDDITNAVIFDKRPYITTREIVTSQILEGNIPNTIAYVSPTGEAPFTTIQSAVNHVNGLGGGMVVVGAGTYDENIVLTGMSNITIRGTGNATLLQPTSGKGITAINSIGNEESNLNIENMKISCTAAVGIDVEFTHYLTLCKLRVETTGAHAVSV